MGVPNGNAVLDQCDVCNGNGSSCVCRDTSEGGPSEAEMCDTRWEHVTYWNHPEQYCKSDQPGRGCKYGYKRCGMNDCCCTSIDWDLNIGCTCGTEDCLGVPGGTAVEDVCGICDGDGTSCLDCMGVPNGNAVLDQCDVCNGNGSSCVCRDTSEGGPSEAEMCDTRWDHVTYWNHPEQYCK